MSSSEITVKLTYDPAAGRSGYWSANVQVGGEHIGSVYWQETKQEALDAAREKAQRFIEGGGIHQETVTL